MERLLGRRDFLKISALSVLGVAASACGAGDNYKNPGPESTEAISRIINDTKAVPTIEAGKKPIDDEPRTVIVPSAELETSQPYVFGEINLSFKEKVQGIVRMEDGSCIEIGFIPSPYVEGISDVGELYKAGDGRAFTLDTEDYTLVAMHSGSKNSVPLEAEPLRSFLEGGVSLLGKMFNEDERKRRADLIMRAEIEFVQKENRENFSVVNLVRIPPEGVGEFMSDAKALMNYAQAEQRMKEKYLVVVFCGWRVPGEEGNDEVGDYTWSRYMIVMKHVSNNESDIEDIS